MAEVTYKDYIPGNARVIVDYNAKDRVKFSYPIEWTYWKAVWCRAYLTIVSFWYNLHFIPIAYIALYLVLPYLIISTIISPSTSTVTVVYNYDFMHKVFPLLCVLFYLFGIPAIFTYLLALDKERLSRWVPKIGYYSTMMSLSKKEKVFNSNDIIDNMAVIHSFSNVFLDFKCTGDFDRYIERIEVIEIPFSYIHRRILMPYLKKKVKNDFVFTARFHFREQPKDGKMEVIFI